MFSPATNLRRARPATATRSQQAASLAGGVGVSSGSSGGGEGLIRGRDSGVGSVGETTPAVSGKRTIPGRPATGTPVPWSILASASRTNKPGKGDKLGKVEEEDSTRPVHVSEFPHLLHRAQANVLQQNLSGGLDKDTSLAWMICGKELYVWNYLDAVSKRCLVLEIPFSVTHDWSTKSFPGNLWTVCMVSWDVHSTPNKVAEQSTSVGVILCNHRTQHVAYWPDIFVNYNQEPVVDEYSRISLESAHTVSDHSMPEKNPFRSFIAAKVPGSFKECAAIACDSAGGLWWFHFSPNEVRRDPLVGTSSIESPEKIGANSLIWEPTNAETITRRFFLLTNCNIQCWSIDLSPDMDVRRLWSHELIGSEEFGIKKDMAGQKDIWLLDMQVDHHEKDFIILVATLCKDRVSGSNYIQYSLLIMHDGSTYGHSGVRNGQVLEKKALQVVIPKARVDDEPSLFSMRLRVGGNPMGSATILSGEGTATIAIYWRGSTRLYKFDLLWDAGKVLDASVLTLMEDREEGSWIVLTANAGVWAIPASAVLVGGVEPPDRSLSRKGSSNERVNEEEGQGHAFNSNDARDEQNRILNTVAHTRLDEHIEVLVRHLFDDFVSSGTVEFLAEKLKLEGAFEKEGDANIFARFSNSIVDTLAKHWTTVREGDYVSSTIASSLLLEKQQKHQKFLQFLVLSKCHEELSSKQRHAMLIVMEHGEKLFSMIKLRELQNSFSRLRSSMSSSFSSGPNNQMSSLWSLIQLVGERARRDNVLLIDRDNAEVFYSKISALEEFFGCLSHQFHYIFSGDDNLSAQMQQAMELSSACLTLIQAAVQYRKEHKEWYPSLEGLVSWTSQAVVRNGIWSVASLVMELLNNSSLAYMSTKSELAHQLEGLTDVLLDAYIILITAKIECQEEHSMLMDEYNERRDQLLGSLYEYAKVLVEAKYQELSKGIDNLELKNSIHIEIMRPILLLAKRHQGYQTLWQICQYLNDTQLLLNLMHQDMSPLGGFSSYVFKELLESCQHAKLLRLGEEFPDQLASFLKNRVDLLWLHEILLHQFSACSDTLHTYAMSMNNNTNHIEPDIMKMKKSPSLAERKQMLYLSKIAAFAGKGDGFETNIKRLEADLQILKLQEEIVQSKGVLEGVASKLLHPAELIELSLNRDRHLAVKALEVFAWTSASFLTLHRRLLLDCWRNAADQDDWQQIREGATTEGWSDEVIQEVLAQTVLFGAADLCYGPGSDAYSVRFDEILPVRRHQADIQTLEGEPLSVEDILMRHKDFPVAGKWMLAAVMMGAGVVNPGDDDTETDMRP